MLGRIKDLLFPPRREPAVEQPKKEKTIYSLAKHPRFYDAGEVSAYDIHIADSALADIMAAFITGGGSEVSGEMVVDEASQTIVAVNFVGTGSPGSVTTTPFERLEAMAELEQRGGGQVNGEWHTHSRSAFFSSTDERDHMIQVPTIADTNPDGGTYYSLVFGGSPDALVRVFWWGMGDDTIYYADVVPTVGRDRVPVSWQRTYHSIVVPGGLGSTRQDWEDLFQEEGWFGERKWDRTQKTIAERGQWKLVSDLYRERKAEMERFATDRGIASLWRATAYFVVEFGEDEDDLDLYVEMLSVDEEPAIQPLLLPLDDDEENDDWLEDYLSRQEEESTLW